MIIEIIILLVSGIVLLLVGYELGRDDGIVIGYERAEHQWSTDFENDRPENAYIDYDEPRLPRVDTKYKFKPKKYRKKFNRHNKTLWFFGDICKIPKRKKKQFPKCEVNKMCKELEEIYGIDEEVCD